MKNIELNEYQELKPLEKIEQNKKQLFISKFDINEIYLPLQKMREFGTLRLNL